ncbi:MAG: methionine--tRNA ligase [Bacteroidia bacterium]|nr:methionine--tRNA ligase [Bacteroidia bacterium]
MSKEPKRYLVTAALPYANGPVHIGHLAGCYLPADIYVRYLKAQGKDVVFICGSDEHGVPITIKAKKEGITPQQVVDKYDGIMKNAFKDFGIDFTYYGRTSSKTHSETAQVFFKNLYQKGVFNEEVTQQYYDEETKQFLADRYITGTCPRCGNPNAYGDQCEKCGTSLNPTDLINPKSALSGAAPVLKETKNWFLPMDAIQQSEQFQTYIKRFDNWKSNIKGQCQSWLTEGLHPRAMTRDLDWGVPVPIDGATGKVLYVWFDAPIGYISATKEYFNGSAEWEKYWKDDETALVHFIGKDNIVFHAIIFPMMLMTHGEFILPTNIPANEFLNLEGDKISTSRNWAVWLHEYLIDFADRQDELRYVLTSIAPETKDSEFTWKDYQTRVNSELVSIFGNFVNRVLVLSNKYYNGVVPDYNLFGVSGVVRKRTMLMEEEIGKYTSEMKIHLNAFRFREALQLFIMIAREGNKYLQELEPWKLVKTDEDSTKHVLYHGIQLCSKLEGLCQIFLPHTSQKLRTQLNFTYDLKDWHNNSETHFIKPGHQLNKPEILYKQVEDAEIEKQLARLQNIKKDNETSLKQNNTTLTLQEVKADIVYDDFDKIDLRVGKVLSAERVPKADKLLILKVDLGFEQRTILSGIAEYYKPEELVGKLVTVVANLAPRKIRGIESQGMLLMAGNDFGKLYSVGPELDIEPGSVVK